MGLAPTTGSHGPKLVPDTTANVGSENSHLPVVIKFGLSLNDPADTGSVYLSYELRMVYYKLVEAHVELRAPGVFRLDSI
jgi:hypothetical protein